MRRYIHSPVSERTCVFADKQRVLAQTSRQENGVDVVAFIVHLRYDVAGSVSDSLSYSHKCKCLWDDVVLMQLSTWIVAKYKTARSSMDSGRCQWHTQQQPLSSLPSLEDSLSPTTIPLRDGSALGDRLPWKSGKTCKSYSFFVSYHRFLQGRTLFSTLVRRAGNDKLDSVESCWTCSFNTS